MKVGCGLPGVLAAGGRWFQVAVVNGGRPRVSPDPRSAQGRQVTPRTRSPESGAREGVACESVAMVLPLPKWCSAYYERSPS